MKIFDEQNYLNPRIWLWIAFITFMLMVTLSCKKETNPGYFPAKSIKFDTTGSTLSVNIPLYYAYKVRGIYLHLSLNSLPGDTIETSMWFTGADPDDYSIRKYYTSQIEVEVSNYIHTINDQNNLTVYLKLNNQSYTGKVKGDVVLIYYNQ